MELQKFVTNVIEAMGGIVIPQEYALCQIMVPELYKEMFQGRDELQLAFDFEVAEENPLAEFVTFGSHIVEQMIAFVNRQAVSAVRFADIDPPVLSGALDKIRRFLSGENGVFNLFSENTVMGTWAVFAFRVAYVAEEREERFDKVWVDMSRGVVCEDMKRLQHLIPLTQTPTYYYPLAPPLELTTALKLAYDQVKSQAEQGRQLLNRQPDLEREKKRIHEYYEELTREMHKRSERKGLSEEKKQELLEKVRSIGLEQQKQIGEMEEQYNVRTEVALDHGFVVMAPLLEYTISITARNQARVTKLHYNPLLKQFSIIPASIGNMG